MYVEKIVVLIINYVQNVIKLSSMKDLMKWVHMVMCFFATATLIGTAISPHITKDQFVGALFVFIYMILIAIALFKED